MCGDRRSGRAGSRRSAGGRVGEKYCFSAYGTYAVGSKNAPASCACLTSTMSAVEPYSTARVLGLAMRARWTRSGPFKAPSRMFEKKSIGADVTIARRASSDDVQTSATMPEFWARVFSLQQYVRSGSANRAVRTGISFSCPRLSLQTAVQRGLPVTDRRWSGNGRKTGLAPSESFPGETKVPVRPESPG